MTPFLEDLLEGEARVARAPDVRGTPAGVLAAVTAIVLHLLHEIETEVLAVITAGAPRRAMFLRSLRSEHTQRRIAAGSRSPIWIRRGAGGGNR